MAWICAREFADPKGTAPQFHAQSVGLGQRRPTDLVTKGTIQADIDFRLDGKMPARLLHYERTYGWDRRFTIYLNADNSLSVEVQQGRARCYGCITDWNEQSASRIRLTVVFDAPARLGLITVECLETGRIHQSTFAGPVPLPLDDIRAMLRTSDTTVDRRLISVSISDKIEPIGPAPSISSGTFVKTEDGPRPIEKLQLGDAVLTANNGFQPVRWILRQQLPNVGSFRQITLRAPYWDLEHDIRVGLTQKIMIDGAEAEYLFGEEAVLIEAQELLGHPSASLSPSSLSELNYQVLLDQHDCINLCGTWAETTFVGRIAERPEVRATSRFSNLTRSSMPVHNQRIKRALKPFETRTLLDSIIA